ncbi:retrovirus-related Pol polyprotein from transposon 412 [Trichonephila clavipes]|nr:retrovirus-related Pol polyprotein from transposon 412 [Trichonephila clavipes]
MTINTPKDKVSTVLKELHGSPSGGHFGVMKTFQKIRSPFERIAFDILGPLPRSSYGNILVVMDYFTKWPEAYLISDQEAPIVAEVIQHWISR